VHSNSTAPTCAAAPVPHTPVASRASEVSAPPQPRFPAAQYFARLAPRVRIERRRPRAACVRSSQSRPHRGNCSSRHDLHAVPRQWFAHRIAALISPTHFSFAPGATSLPAPHTHPASTGQTADTPDPSSLPPSTPIPAHPTRSRRHRARTYLISNMFDYVPACFFKGEHFK